MFLTWMVDNCGGGCEGVDCCCGGVWQGLGGRVGVVWLVVVGSQKRAASNLMVGGLGFVWVAWGWSETMEDWVVATGLLSELATTRTIKKKKFAVV